MVRNIEYNPFYTKITGKALHIQMELCSMTLKKAIKKIDHELNECQEKSIIKVGSYITTQFLYEIVDAVYYLHSQSPKIIHRDLKPENIFVTEGSNGNFIKIGDFGLAVEYGNMDEEDHKNIRLSQGQGTLKFIAPEVENSNNYNEKCDIYSMGAVGWTICNNW